MRSTPSAQAISRPCAPTPITRPGNAPGAAASARADQMRRRSPASSVSAIGQGLKARTLRSRAMAEVFQCSRASALSSLCAYSMPVPDCARASGRLPATSRDRPSPSTSAPSRARRSCRLPPVSSSAIGVRRSSSTGPVSRPASICIRATPDCRSPARIARWIGAAPRQRGSSEACTFQQPCTGIASTDGDRMRP